LGYSGRIALRREQYDVFTPCRNLGVTEVCKHGDYATIMKIVFTPCCSEPWEFQDRDVTNRTAPRSIPRQRRCKHDDDATVLFIATFSVRSDSKIHDDNNRTTEWVLRSEFSERFYGEEISQSARSSEVWSEDFA
jgi:hypothetical protein